jgi:hypothetical protein
MTKPTRGRWTHELDGVEDLTVFLIGMRVNKIWRPDGWLPVAMAMRPMLEELSRDPESGLLGFRTLIGGRGPTMVQYWRSAEALYRYASDPSGEHHPAWAAFNRRARKVPGVVGIWHETFPVRAAESVYVDMPTTGLALAAGARPVTRRLDRARDRIAPGAA